MAHVFLWGGGFDIRAFDHCEDVWTLCSVGQSPVAHHPNLDLEPHTLQAPKNILVFTRLHDLCMYVYVYIYTYVYMCAYTHLHTPKHFYSHLFAETTSKPELSNPKALNTKSLTPFTPTLDPKTLNP